MTAKSKSPEVLILDVDGVLTTGHFIYDSQGKKYKIFGPDDNDALSLIQPLLKIHFVTGDQKGFEISRARIECDMGYPLSLVSTTQRVDWIQENYNVNSVIYMGDGIFDHYVMQKVSYSIAPANADNNAKNFANYVTQRSSGDRAVAEACLHILEKFFTPYNPKKPLINNIKYSGNWSA
jgi:3-deoxy-D-manno-octulosonate 8-phosphate phosphatase (KDO 8-P phosphatase)